VVIGGVQVSHHCVGHKWQQALRIELLPGQVTEAPGFRVGHDWSGTSMEKGSRCKWDSYILERMLPVP